MTTINRQGQINVNWKHYSEYTKNYYILVVEYDDKSKEIIAELFYNMSNTWTLKLRNSDAEIFVYRHEAFEIAESEARIFLGLAEVTLSRPRG